MPAKLLQSCLTLCDPMYGSLPGSSVHGILWAGILEWLTMGVSGNLWIVVKDVKTLAVYDVE